jgi:hypothetical protein
MMPRVDCYEKHIHIHSQKFSAFIKAKQIFRIKIIIPENIRVHIKLFSGESNISGVFNQLTLNQRSGTTLVNAGYLSVLKNSMIENILGNIEVHHSNKESIPTEPGYKYLLNSTKDKGKIQLRAHTAPLVFFSD